MALKVGELFYDVTLDTSKMIQKQREVERSNAETAASFGRIGNALTAVARAVGVYAAALALVKATRVADEVRLLGARIEVAAGSAEKGAEALAELQRISARTQTDLAANSGVFNRLNQSILQMGGTQQDTLRITELLGKAIKVSGASGVEASSAMIQFGQALGSGKLAGDELRSLLENAPYLMRQLADGLGVPIGALKQLGEDGKLTADVVVNALGKAAQKIDADFKKLPSTFEGAMAVASDAARKATEALDKMTGTSAALTGATTGVGQVLEALARQFNEATTEADKLGRKGTITTWADITRTAMSYVADAVDVVVRGFKSLNAVMTGLERVRDGQSIAESYRQVRAELAALVSQPLSGVRIRREAEENERNSRLENRGFTPETSGSALRSKAPAEKKGKFDAEAYIAGLRKAMLEGIEQIDAVEQEALRRNAELLRAGKITRQQAAEAATLIEVDAAQQRRDIWMREAEENRLRIQKDGEEDARELQRQAQARGRGQGFARQTIGSEDPIAALQFELEEKSKMLREYARQDMDNLELYSQAQIALERETQAKIAEIIRQRQDQQLAAQSQMLQGYSSLFGSMADIARTFGGEQDKTYKAMFAVSKAFAIADSLVKIQQGIANSLSLPYPANIAAAASTAAAAANIVATIKGVNYGGGRQFGGQVSGGTLYRVNETGRPEMFTASNGTQYMLPTADGRVVPANQVGAAGGGGGVQINVHNYAGADVQATASPDGRIVEIAVRQAKAEIAQEIASNSGQTWQALRSATNIKPALGA